MDASHVCERFVRLKDRAGPDDYNFEHFGLTQLVGDARRTLRREGIAPDDPAPDFVLERADGGMFRLSSLRGVPALLHFGSFT